MQVDGSGAMLEGEEEQQRQSHEATPLSGTAAPRVSLGHASFALLETSLCHLHARSW